MSTILIVSIISLHNVFLQPVNEISLGDLLSKVLKIEQVIDVVSKFPGKGRTYQLAVINV